ncbi:helix-turn-helix transcriptional regulator [Pseudomonas sp. BGr12]|uniref:helix-turn-helix transcriptional regulator n=1 Tax=Pseudomonas sp. BGr12 TaxID=2936269 RepID=UPI002559A98A|nr:WYL domain-containing protein [Pseudomonas sp. BJa5]MDL2428468.1 WYL domain-containing protein [Pseudomonas sp. BJa5]
MTVDIPDHTQAQHERLAYIDLNLWFLGEIRRQSLMSRFQIQSASATRDLALYIEIAPENLAYDSSAKTYYIGDSFKPLYEFSPERVLTWLSQGFADGFPGVWSAGVPAIHPPRLGQPRLDTLGVVTRAIYQEKPLRIRYESLTGSSTRVIVPHTLIDNGFRWHVRGYDRKHGEFRDFVITRIIDPEILSGHLVREQERRTADSQWDQSVTLTLVPHPDQPRPKVTHLDYGMTKGRLKMTVPAMSAGYTLRQWNVDCSPDHSLRGPEFRLWLQNHEVLGGLSNAVLAPGYRQEGEV